MQPKYLYLSLMTLLCIWGNTQPVAAQLDYNPTTNSYASSTGATSSTGTTSGATTPLSTPSTTSNTSSTYAIPDPSSYRGTLSAMHIELDASTKAIMDKLSTHLNNLDVSKSASLQQAADRLRILTCLGIIAPTSNIYDVLKTSATNLQNSIEIVRTDMHASIGSLEEKINKGLLDRLVQQLEISSMQNKIDSFKVQYMNVVDLFFEVSIGEVETVEQLFTNLSAAQQQQLDAYTKTNAAYQSVINAYTTFLQTSGATSTSTNNLAELLSLSQGLKAYRRSVLITSWIKQVAAYAPLSTQHLAEEQKLLLTQDFSLLFNETTQGSLGTVYPMESLLRLHQQILALRSAYTDETNGFADCNAFITNPSVLIVGPELETYMKTLTTQLQTATSLSTTNIATEIKTTKNSLSARLQPLITNLIINHKAKLIETITAQSRSALLTTARLTLDQQLEIAVREYLQKRYLQAFDTNTLAPFQKTLATVISTIDTKLAQGSISTSKTKFLLIIKSVVAEFLAL